MLRLKSQSEWIERAAHVLPGGGFGNFDPSVFISEGKGSRVWDENRKEYVDYLEQELNVPIKIVSVGPDRTQTLICEN